MADPYLAQIMTVAFNFAPLGWATCDGQLLPINQYPAVFSLIGTFYGGNGTSNFQLPDLRGRKMVHQGQGSGLPTYVIGQVGGVEQATLTLQNLPSHTHAMTSSFSVSGVSPKASAQAAAAGSVLGHSDDIALGGTAKPAIYCPAGTTANVALGGLNVSAGLTGNSLPVATLDPYLVINCIFALNGVFPSRN